VVYRWPNCIREAAPLQASRHFRGQLQQSRRRACLQSNRAKPSPGPKAQESPRCRGGECAPLGPGSESPSASAPLGIGPTRKSLLVPRPPPQCQIRRGNAAPGFGLAQGGLLLRAVPPTLMAERMQPRAGPIPDSASGGDPRSIPAAGTVNNKKSRPPSRPQFLFPRTTEFDQARCNAGFRRIRR